MIDCNDGHTLLYGTERTPVGVLMDDAEMPKTQRFLFDQWDSIISEHVGENYDAVK